MTTINNIRSREDLVAALQTGGVSCTVTFTNVKDIQSALRLCSDDRFRKANPKFYLVVNKLGQYLSEFTDDDYNAVHRCKHCGNYGVDQATGYCADCMTRCYYRYKYVSISTEQEHTTYYNIFKCEEEDLIESLGCGDEVMIEFVECSEIEYMTSTK